MGGNQPSPQLEAAGPGFFRLKVKGNIVAVFPKRLHLAAGKERALFMSRSKRLCRRESGLGTACRGGGFVPNGSGSDRQPRFTWTFTVSMEAMVAANRLRRMEREGAPPGLRRQYQKLARCLGERESRFRSAFASVFNSRPDRGYFLEKLQESLAITSETVRTPMGARTVRNILGEVRFDELLSDDVATIRRLVAKEQEAAEKAQTTGDAEAAAAGGTTAAGGIDDAASGVANAAAGPCGDSAAPKRQWAAAADADQVPSTKNTDAEGDESMPIIFCQGLPADFKTNNDLAALVDLDASSEEEEPPAAEARQAAAGVPVRRRRAGPGGKQRTRKVKAQIDRSDVAGEATLSQLRQGPGSKTRSGARGARELAMLLHIWKPDISGSAVDGDGAN